MRSLFITGTDTDVGKTVVSSILIKSFSEKVSTAYFKPIQAGSPTDTCTIKKYVGTHAKILQSVYQLEKSISPNRAAMYENVDIRLEEIEENWRIKPKGIYIVEGAGGIEVPLNKENKISDLILRLNLPVVLVASTKLGTINHTLLSLELLKSKNIECLGIVLVGDEDPGLKDLLEQQGGVSVLFQVPFLNDLSTNTLDLFIRESKDLENFRDSCLSIEIKNKKNRILEQWDKDFVWHPFTQHGIVKDHPVVTRANGAYLFCDDKKILDAVSSWWVNLFGHCHPNLSEAVSRQAYELEHVMFAGFSHEPAISLSKKLIELTKTKECLLEKVFYSDNGSTAVEVALKMVYQYHQQINHPNKNKFLALKGSYHGDTLGAMSVGERDGFNNIFQPLMFDVDFVDPFNIKDLEDSFKKHGEEYAAVILEPMVQGALGMRMYSSSFLNRLKVLADQHNCLIICDEIFTGFYRTGKMFAFEHSELRPDILCLSKGLTGGYLPLAATLASSKVYEIFKGKSMKSAFLHGHSYTANPIACRVACATLDLLKEDKTLAKINNIQVKTSEILESLNENKILRNIRQLGTVGAMEIADENASYFSGDFSYKFHKKALEKGVLLRPLGGTVYAVPPYCVTDNELEKIYKTIDKITREGF